MRMLLRSHNFQGKLTLVEKDRRELVHEPSNYDRFLSIGVHEHAGRGCNEQWIRSIVLALRPGGIGLISVTFNMKKRPTNCATIKHIFPGGFLCASFTTLPRLANRFIKSDTSFRTRELPWIESASRYGFCRFFRLQ
jgi:cyclopropane-fatty-acyl-phospholipid synthase